MGVLLVRSISGSDFSTTFPDTENPISQGGVWTLGDTHGLDWQDVRTEGGSPGTAYGVGASAGYDDCLAFLQNRFTNNKHWSRMTVRKDGGYTPPDTHEIELWGLGAITANSATGYELDFGFGLSGPQPVRWNGPLGDFDTGAVTTVSGASFTIADNDVIWAKFDSTSGSPVISIWKNPATNPITTVVATDLVLTDVTAGKILTGSPGIGFFARAGTGLDMTKYAIRGFAAGSA